MRALQEVVVVVVGLCAFCGHVATDPVARRPHPTRVGETQAACGACFRRDAIILGSTSEAVLSWVVQGWRATGGRWPR